MRSLKSVFLSLTLTTILSLSPFQAAFAQSKPPSESAKKEEALKKAKQSAEKFIELSASFKDGKRPSPVDNPKEFVAYSKATEQLSNMWTYGEGACLDLRKEKDLQELFSSKEKFYQFKRRLVDDLLEHWNDEKDERNLPAPRSGMLGSCTHGQ